MRKRIPTVKPRIIPAIFLAGGLVCLFLGLSSIPATANDTLKADLAFNAANGMMENQMYDMAREQWEEFLRDFPEDNRRTAASHLLGVCFFQNRDYTNAVARFSVAGADPKFELREESLYLEGLSYYEMAEAALREDKNAAPDSAANSPAGKDYQKSAELLQKVLTDFPKTRFRTEALFYRAVSLHRMGRSPEAQQLFSALRREQRTPADFMMLSLYTSAEISLQTQKTTEAIQFLDQLLQFYSRTAAAPATGVSGGAAGSSGIPLTNIRLRALCMRASVLFSSKKYPEAQQAYATILADKDFLAAENSRETNAETGAGVDFPGVYYNYADILLRNGRYEQATQAFTEFRKRFPESPFIARAAFQQTQAMRWANDAARKAGKTQTNDHQAIFTLLEEAFRHPSAQHDVSLCNSAGHQLMLALLQRHKPEEAMDVFSKVAEVNKTQATELTYSLLKDQADILAALGRNAEAVAIYEKLAKDYKNNAKMVLFATDCAYQAVYLYGKDGKFREQLAYALSIMQEPAYQQMSVGYRQAISQEAAAAAYRLQDFAQSGRIYLDLLKNYPQHESAPQWTLYVAHGYQMAGQYAEVVKWLTSQKIKQLTPPAVQIEAGHILGFCLTRLGQKNNNGQEKQRQLAQAMHIFSDAITLMRKEKPETYPRADILCYDYAEMCFSQEKYSLCQSSLAYIFTNFPGAAILDKVYFLQGRCAVAEKNPTVAVEAFQTIIEKYPQSPLMPDALLAASQCLLNLGRSDEARQYAARLLEQFPEDRLADSGANVRAILAMDSGNYDEAAAAWEKILASAQPELRKLRLDALYGLGMCRMHQKNYPDAEKHFRTILHENAAWAAADKVYYQLGWALLEQKKPDDAKAFFETLTKKFPGSELVRESVYQLAIYTYRQGNVEEAGRLFQQLVTQNAEDAIAQNARLPLAWMYYKQKKYDTARQYALSVLTTLEDEMEDIPEGNRQTDRAANMAELKFLIGQCDYALSQWDSAYRFINDSMQGTHLTPAYRQDAMVALIKIDETKENWPEVQRLSEQYIEEFPDSPQRMLIRYKTALALFNQDKKDEAGKRFLQIVDEDKGIHAARSLFMLGEIQFLKKDYTGAIKTFYQVIYGFEDEQLQADAMYEAARCFEMLGQKDKAVTHFRQLMEKYPKSDKVETAKKKIEQGGK